jgi:hypothetical protein
MRSSVWATRHADASGISQVDILTKLLRVLWIPEYRGPFLRTRVAASTEHDRILPGLQLRTVVDIGANRGQFALCIRRLYPQAQIYSFEPLKKPALAWMRNFGADPRAKLLTKPLRCNPVRPP